MELPEDTKLNMWLTFMACIISLLDSADIEKM